MTTSTGVAAADIRRWRNAIFVIFFVAGIMLASYMARVPRVRDALGATTLEMSFVTLAVAAGSITGMSAASAVLTRFGAKRVMRVFATLMCVGLIVAGLGVAALSLPIIIVGMVIAGLGMGTTDVSMNLSGAANERALGRTIMPIFHAVFSFGTMAGAGLGALAEHLDVPIVYHLITVSVVAGVGVWLTNGWIQSEKILGEDGEHETEPNARERRAVWAQSATWLIGLIVLGMALTEGSANDWLALAMVDGHDASNFEGAIALGTFLTAMTLGRIAGVRVLDRFGRVPVLRGTAVIAALGLALVIFGPTPLAYVGIVLWGLGASLGFPVGMSAAADDPRWAAARVSAVAMIGYVAFLAGPPIIGFLGEHFGLLKALLVVLVAIATAGLCAGAAREKSRSGDLR